MRFRGGFASARESGIGLSGRFGSSAFDCCYVYIAAFIDRLDHHGLFSISTTVLTVNDS